MMSLGFLALPISKVHVQADYKPISKSNTYGLPLYSLESVAPEMIYNYGDKIPTIKAEQGLTIPNTKEFGLLTNTLNPETVAPLSKLYTIEFIDTFDLNTSHKDARDYRTRLVNKLYKLTRK